LSFAYTLRTKEALDFYMEKIYPSHLNSFPLFGTEVHGVRAAKEDVEPRLLEHFHNCCGADWLICGRLAIGLLDSAPQAKRIANPLQDTILPHNICENALVPASYAAGEDLGEVDRRYMQGTEFADDIRNFNVSDIVGVESTILISSTTSPLK
jgi:hypothetical protein